MCDSKCNESRSVGGLIKGRIGDEDKKRGNEKMSNISYNKEK